VRVILWRVARGGGGAGLPLASLFPPSRLSLAAGA